MLKLGFDVHEINGFPPFADIEYELAQMSGSNSLEELGISVIIQMEGTFDMDPLAWRALDAVLSRPMGFALLKKLHIKIIVGLYVPDEAEVVELDRKLRGLVEDGFKWSKENLHFTSDINVIHI